MAAMHTTMIRASITAYSTAVGPSSFFRNSTNFRVMVRMVWLGPIRVAGEGKAGGSLRPPGQAQLPVGVAFSATLENVLLAFEPRVVMAAMHTTMMRASMTAYSTAVGPSSFFRKATSLRVIRFIAV